MTKNNVIEEAKQQVNILQSANIISEITSPLLDLITYAESLETEWISVEKDLPHNHTDVLVYAYNYSRDNGIPRIIESPYYNDRFEVYDTDNVFNITHWMPLPQEPKK